MVSQGLEKEAIAERVGCTVSSLKTLCSKQTPRISLIPFTKLHAGFKAKPDPMAVQLTLKTADYIAKMAKAQGIEPEAYVVLLLDTIANDNLHNAVLG